VSQRPRILIGMVILLVIIGVILGVDYWRFQSDSTSKENAGSIPPGSIPIHLNGELVASIVPDDLDHLSMTSFVEEEEGKTEEGWLLRDVMMLYVGEDNLQASTIINVSSSSREKSAQLTWEEVQNLDNMVLFDLASRGTLKLVSRLEKLDTRDEWVQDVDKIEIEP